MLLQIDVEAGEIEVKFPITTSVSREDRVRSTMGNGRGHIKIRSGAGNIRLLPR